MILGTISAKSQIVDDVDLSTKPEIKYVQLVGYNKALFSKKIVIFIDYGQEFEIFGDPQVIKNESSETIVFNSMVDALNFMYDNNWEYLNSYPIATGSSMVYHYLLQRKETE